MSFHLQADLVAAGLDTPTFAASPPGEPDVLFILEKQTGLVRVLDLATGEIAAQPFFQVPPEELTTIGERGLLGLAFHPDYVTNGRLYLDFNNEEGETEIWEVTRSSADPRRADPATVRTLLTIDRTATNHNGGWLGFGPDGYLYVSSGDSGRAGDPENAAQNLDDLRGKLLRIDVDADDFPADPGRNYAIPGDNPFVGLSGADEIFAYGLRNPWRASFDPLTGDLYIADVGQNAREELDYLPAGTGAGTNFGWRVLEGTLATGYPALSNPGAGLHAPVLEYPHGMGDFEGHSITGGYVLRDGGVADGVYFFADFSRDHLWTVRLSDGRPTEWTQHDATMVVNGGSVNNIASFAQDGDGALYAIGLDGDIHRLTAVADDVVAAQQPDTDESFFGLGDVGDATVAIAAVFGWLI